ncbi:MAG: type II toxin-antitoxin system prevent-host-death family antitoxin [Mariprofundus sp.]|nr:type II toxin-antitoxin system prevent-host-death family antitoxin [Mariprofundus sp.]
MKTNAVDLRRNMKDIMRAVDRHEPVKILYHGKERAVILPIKQPVAPAIRNHPFFGMDKDEGYVEAVIDKLRDGRY